MSISDQMISLIAAPLLVSAIIGLFLMWRDIAVLKRDVDALADIIGTTRAKDRRSKSDK